MKDFRVEVKIRNNRLYSRIMKRWGSIPLFAECVGIQYQSIIYYLSFRINPIGPDKTKKRYSKKFYIEINGLPWKKSAVKIADTLGCTVLDLWPDEYFRAVRKNEYFFEIDKEDMLNLTYQDRVLLTQGSPTLEGFNIENIDNVLNTLKNRERKIIELRFGLNGNKTHTLQEIGNIEGVTKERVRGIEAKALRKLRQPSKRKIWNSAPGSEVRK